MSLTIHELVELDTWSKVGRQVQHVGMAVLDKVFHGLLFFTLQCLMNHKLQRRMR